MLYFYYYNSMYIKYINKSYYLQLKPFKIIKYDKICTRSSKFNQEMAIK